MAIKTEDGRFYEMNTASCFIPLNGVMSCNTNTQPEGFVVANPEFQTANFVYGHVWQLCPKCNGSGIACANDSFNVTKGCDVCNGKKIISSVTGLPPQ